MENNLATVRWAPKSDKELRHYLYKECELCHKAWWAVAEDGQCDCGGALWPSGYHPAMIADKYGEPYLAQAI